MHTAGARQGKTKRDEEMRRTVHVRWEDPEERAAQRTDVRVVRDEADRDRDRHPAGPISHTFRQTGGDEEPLTQGNQRAGH